MDLAHLTGGGGLRRRSPLGDSAVQHQRCLDQTGNVLRSTMRLGLSAGMMRMMMYIVVVIAISS